MRPLLERIWYGRHPLGLALAPLGWLWAGVARVRRLVYRQGWRRVARLPVPVIVVGNLSVGGTGKTPLVTWLFECLTRQGYHPGILTRGYGGRARHWPQQVRPDSDPEVVGDEALVLARHCEGPVAAGPDRVAAAMALLAHSDCDVLLSDDGLQHYALGRDIEIAVVDGTRRLGSGRCLPAGPLREPRSRLAEVDMVVTSGPALRGEFPMRYLPLALRNLREPAERMGLDALRGRRVHAVAGLGNPARFFALLRAHGLEVTEHAFPDHHRYRVEELDFDDALPVVMTEKDAVKCERFAGADWWCLPVEADLPEAFERRLLATLTKVHQRLERRLDHGQETA